MAVTAVLLALVLMSMVGLVVVVIVRFYIGIKRGGGFEGRGLRFWF